LYPSERIHFLLLLEPLFAKFGFTLAKKVDPKVEGFVLKLIKGGLSLRKIVGALKAQNIVISRGTV
jgi:hypothetical protein